MIPMTFYLANRVDVDFLPEIGKALGVSGVGKKKPEILFTSEIHISLPTVLIILLYHKSFRLAN